MQNYSLLATQYVVIGACAGFAYVQGDTGARLGAAWFALNMAVSAAVNFLGLDSTLAHLVEDGVFALGLLPLAMIFVSYWIGLVTLSAAALFSLEAVYLLNDRPVDNVYAWINNTLWYLIPIIFLASGFANLLRNRSARRELSA